MFVHNEAGFKPMPTKVVGQSYFYSCKWILAYGHCHLDQWL